MTKILRAVAGAVTIGFATFPSAVVAQNAIADATATVQTQIAVQATQPLEFGIIVSGGSTGYMTIEPEGNVSECTAASCFGVPQPAHFLISGAPNQIVNISHAGTSMDPITFSLSDGANSTTFGLILHTPVLTLNATGNGGVEFGARIVVPANLPSGNYSGQFEISVDYQ